MTSPLPIAIGTPKGEGEAEIIAKVKKGKFLLSK